jgi:hypothetical protein
MATLIGLSRLPIIIRPPPITAINTTKPRLMTVNWLLNLLQIYVIDVATIQIITAVNTVLNMQSKCNCIQ